MTAEEIKQLCISSSKVYYDYLERTGKGLNEVDVWAVEIVNQVQRLVSLRLSKKIFDAETVFFRFAGDAVDYDSTQIDVIEYDVDKNILYVEPKGEIFQRFINLHASNIKVVADMKFLVQRVTNWFEQKGSGLQLPQKTSGLEKASVKFENTLQLVPGTDQLAAIRAALTRPFSYIWGAPGTGKTQLVLANIVIQYARQNKRCIILAPTNTALEQVMKGVMRMSDAAGIPRDKFLRLGHTSKWFAEQYPEICETFGMATQRLQLEKQMRVLRSVMKQEKTHTDDVLLKLEDALEKLTQLKELLDVSTGKAGSKKLLRQLLKEAQKGLAAHPFTETLGKTLEPDTLHSTLSTVKGFVEKQRREEAVLQAKAVEYNLLPESELKQMYAALEDSRKKMKGSNERAKAAIVVACTLDGYINRFLEDELEVEHIFLDEAGYACTIKALTLMKGDVPVTFLGDHLQLPPVCEMNDMDFNDEKSRDAFIWSKSAIHLPRLFEDGKDAAYNAYINNEETLSRCITRTDLRYTHRFGDNLARVLNDYVYQNGFSSDSGKGETEIYFVNVETPVPQPRNGMDKPTRESELEAAAIRNFIHTTGLTDYAVLTPYINQVKLLGKLLTRERNEGRILTVHGAQGKEWDNVLLSVVDTDKKWFTDSKFAKTRGLYLLNTAVSRAKRRLIIFCNTAFWKKQNGQLIKGLLDVAQEWPML